MPEPSLMRLREILIGFARKKNTVTYNELAIAFEMPPPHRIHRLTLMLEDLVREDHTADLPLLAAVAVSRGHEGIPGRGFFQLLAELGHYQGPDRGAEAAIWHQRELSELFALHEQGEKTHS